MQRACTLLVAAMCDRSRLFYLKKYLKKKSNIFRRFGQKLHRASFVGRTRCVLLVPLAKGPMTAVPDSARASVASPNETERFVVRAMQ